VLRVKFLSRVLLLESFCQVNLSEKKKIIHRYNLKKKNMPWASGRIDDLKKKIKYISTEHNDTHTQHLRITREGRA